MDKIYEEVEEFLEYIKQEMKRMNLDANDVFLNGDCGNLYKMFVKRFPKFAKPFLITYDGKPYHILTGIGEKIYDIRGETSLEDYVEYFMKSEDDPKLEKEKFTIKPISVGDSVITTEKLCNNYIKDDIITGEQYKINHLISILERKIEERSENGDGGR